MIHLCLLILPFITPIQDPATEPELTLVYIRYGNYKPKRKTFRNRDFFDISRPDRYPKPGDRIRALRQVRVFSLPERKASLYLGRLPIESELEIERVLPLSKPRKMRKFRGRELWIEVHIDKQLLETAVPNDMDEEDDLLDGR